MIAQTAYNNTTLRIRHNTRHEYFEAGGVYVYIYYVLESINRQYVLDRPISDLVYQARCRYARIGTGCSLVKYKSGLKCTDDALTRALVMLMITAWEGDVGIRLAKMRHSIIGSVHMPMRMRVGKTSAAVISNVPLFSYFDQIFQVYIDRYDRLAPKDREPNLLWLGKEAKTVSELNMAITFESILDYICAQNSYRETEQIIDMIYYAPFAKYMEEHHYDALREMVQKVKTADRTPLVIHQENHNSIVNNGPVSDARFVAQNSPLTARAAKRLTRRAAKRLKGRAGRGQKGGLLLS